MYCITKGHYILITLTHILLAGLVCFFSLYLNTTHQFDWYKQTNMAKLMYCICQRLKDVNISFHFWYLHQCVSVLQWIILEFGGMKQNSNTNDYKNSVQKWGMEAFIITIYTLENSFLHISQLRR